MNSIKLFDKYEFNSINLFIFSKSDFEVNGFTYHIYDFKTQTNTVQIVNYSNNSDSFLKIPPKITYQSIEYTVISISSNTFSSSNISQFEIIYFPYTLLEIEDGAFSNFRNLNTISYITEDNELINNTFPPLLTKINDNAFSNCQMLTTIDTNNVIELGTSCFQFCIRLTNLNLRSVEIIGSYSLASIQLLQEIEF